MMELNRIIKNQKQLIFETDDMQPSTSSSVKIQTTEIDADS